MHLFISLPLMLLVLSLLTIFSFFFSASETSIIGLSKIRLQHMVSKGVKRAQSVQRLVFKLDNLLVAVLIGNNFVNTAISALVTVLCIQFFGYNWGVVIATFATTTFIVVLCEIIPKILATKHTEKIALLVSPLMEKVVAVFNPFVAVFTRFSDMILHLLHIQPVKRSPLVTEEELRVMIEVGKEEGVLSDEERKMLHKIFEFGDIKVSDVMVRREDIVAVNILATSEEVLNKFVEEGHARLPVYNGTIDNIAGIIYSHDLLYILRDKGLFLLQDLLHKPYCVPGTMRVNELLRKFQSDKIQIAIVVDQNKKTLGIVTLEDLLEEIVGEIEEKVAAPNHRS